MFLYIFQTISESQYDHENHTDHSLSIILAQSQDEVTLEQSFNKQSFILRPVEDHETRTSNNHLFSSSANPIIMFKANQRDSVFMVQVKYHHELFHRKKY